MLSLKRILKNYESEARTLAELMPWMILLGSEGELVLQKDGSMLACFAFSGVDQEGKEPFEVDYYANLIENGIRNLDERITIWWTVDRSRTTEYAGGEFDNEISRGINNIWKETFNTGDHYINRYYISILFTPIKGADNLMDQFSYFTNMAGYSPIKAAYEAIKSSFFKGNAFSYSAAQMDDYIRTFNEMIGAFDNTMRDIGMRRLKGESLLMFLHDRCSPASNGQPVKSPYVPIHLDGYLPTDSLKVNGEMLEFTGTTKKSYVMAMGLKDWPDWSFPGMIDGLSSINGEITLSQCFRVVAQDKASKYIEDIERHNRNLAKPLRSHIKEAIFKEPADQFNQHRVAFADDASHAKIAADSGKVFGYYNLTILTYGDTAKECNDVYKDVARYFMQNGFLIIKETLHLLSAWAGTNPGQWAEVIRWYFVNGGNMSDLAPARTLWCGDKINAHLSEQLNREVPALSVFSTNQATPFYFNLFHAIGVGHALVVGPTRSGKSIFDNFLISQFLKYKPCNIFIFDKDYSCRIATLLQDGNYIDIAGQMGGDVKLNPMKLIGDKANWEWLKNWIEGLLTAHGYKMTTDDQNELWKAMESVAASPEKNWRLQSLYTYLPSVLAEELSPWIGSGPNARYFDNEEDNFSLGSFNAMEIGGIFHNPRLATAFLEYAFYRIVLMLTGDPTVIYIEEAWFMLADEQFANRINDWLRTFGKKLAAVVIATQSLQEIAESPIFASLIDNIPTRIYLPNPNVNAHHDLYKHKFGLNDVQINQIRTGIPKKNYYIVTADVSRMVYVEFPSSILDCLRSDSKAQNLFTKLYKKTDDWKERYLKEIRYEKA